MEEIHYLYSLLFSSDFQSSVDAAVTVDGKDAIVELTWSVLAVCH